MGNIVTKKGEKILVDDELQEILESFSWYLVKGTYACTTIGGKQFLMHRMITNAKKGDVVDHKNRNTLDNRRSNLRKVCKSKNVQNSRRYQSVQFIGVFWEDGKFKAQIKDRGKTIYLGRFEDPIEAAKRYDKMALEIYGKDALTNTKFFTDVYERLCRGT